VLAKREGFEVGRSPHTILSVPRRQPAALARFDPTSSEPCFNVSWIEPDIFANLVEWDAAFADQATHESFGRVEPGCKVGDAEQWPPNVVLATGLPVIDGGLVEHDGDSFIAGSMPSERRWRASPLPQRP